MLSPTTREALDALIHTDIPGDEAGQAPLFPVQSDLANLKDGADAVKVVTVRHEIEKLQQLRVLGLPNVLFEGVPVKLMTHDRQRASTEPPRELRRHPPHVRSTLLAALCWQRPREITDTLVDLLIHIAHRIGCPGTAVLVSLTRWRACMEVFSSTQQTASPSSANAWAGSYSSNMGVALATKAGSVDFCQL